MSAACAEPGIGTRAGSARGLRRAIDRRVLVGGLAHAVVVALALAAPLALAVPVVGVAMVWGSNTVSHIHLHTPLFGARRWNEALTWYLTVALGVPQALWRHRHLRHHALHEARVPALSRGRVATEVGAIAVFAGALLGAGVGVAWLAGTALGYGLSAMQGRMEHLAGARDGWSTYGAWHNRLWFNDGLHAEHHRWPGAHWSELPGRRLADARTSARSPLMRVSLRPWLLELLERLVLHVAPLRRAVVRAHARATERVLSGVEVRHALIVGGGIFPRTAMVLSQVRPGARLTVLDADGRNLGRARALLLGGTPAVPAADRIAWREGLWTPEVELPGVDLVTLPLALRGERFAAGASRRLVHAWIWERRGARSQVVAWWLLKRVVLIEPR